MLYLKSVVKFYMSIIKSTSQNNKTPVTNILAFFRRSKIYQIFVVSLSFGFKELVLLKHVCTFDDKYVVSITDEK